MLVRAARRKIHYDAFRHLKPSAEPLYLPWLCPAQFQPSIHLRSTATVATPSQRAKARKDSSSKPAANHSNRRALATAAAEQRLSYDDYVPFEGPPSAVRVPTDRGRFWYESASLADIKHFDPASPIIINRSLDTAPQRFNQLNGVGGEIAEMLLTLEACLTVGRYERSRALLWRLARALPQGSQELRDAFNKYLRQLVSHIIRERDQGVLRDVQQWFEVEMRGEGVLPDATSYALLIKASLQTLRLPKMDRTVRRYMELASASGYDVEVLSSRILSDSELHQVTKLCPVDYYTAASEDPTDPSDHETRVSNLPREIGAILEVRPAEQKGLGLEALRKSLSIFSDSTSIPYPHGLEGTQEEKDRIFSYMRQKRLEEDAVNSAIDRWREESENLRKIGLSSALQNRTVGALMWDWLNALTPIIEEELRNVDQSETKEKKNSSDNERCIYGPYLRFLAPEKLAAITILSVMGMIASHGFGDGAKVSSVIMHVGNYIQDESIAESIKDNSNRDTWSHLPFAGRQRYLLNLIKNKNTYDSLAKLISKKTQQVPGSESPEDREWSLNVKTKVGAVLMSSLLQAAKMQVEREHPDSKEKFVQVQSAFVHAIQFKRGSKIGMLMANATLVEKLKREPVHGALAKHLPMVVEPKRWTGFVNGGFLKFPVKVVRVKSGLREQQEYAKAAAEKGDMDQVFAGLDVLAKTPWIINRGVFDVMLEAWNSGEALASIPPEKPDLIYPPEPEPSSDPMIRRRWVLKIREIENKKAGLHSQRCFQNFQLEVARAFLNEKGFYFPHNVDFRGRAYPVPPYLNHMGADNCRGLLMFGEGRPLGAAGLKWLKIHLANVFGYDKASLEDRQSFSVEHIHDIYDSATNPINGKRWWLKAEDPWQCLAACMELRQALDSPDPTTFVSHLPIHQDGTCNGLQHYAALGGDVWGARQVNLEPGDRPGDIYSAVADLVKESLAKDIETNPVAKALEGKITRKVVKQTVMTNVYGVTFSGARAQVRKQLEDLYPDFPDTADVSYGGASTYIARKIFRALSTMFQGAHDIQYWLGECASRISQALTPEQLERIESDSEGGSKSSVDHAQFKSSVIWTTPLMMPVVQPYRSSKTRVISTNLQAVSIKEPRSSDPINRRQQLQGFPPNFIHSLDATHMFLSALKCDELGLSFAAVHDSFWTHAADVEKMNIVLRDAFIRMHKEEVIARLATEFAARYKGSLYQASIRSDSPVAKKIEALRKRRPSTSRGQPKINELLRERTRLQLLQSDDPVKQQQGHEMITPASIYEEAAGDKELQLAEELAEIGIGVVPEREAKLKTDKQLDVGEKSTVGSIEGIFAEPDSQLDPNQTSAHAVDEEVELNDEGLESDEKEVKVKEARSRKTATPKTKLWLPLTFPPVPKKVSSRKTL
ncbi:MAG: DNA-directed RNA polymerase [Pycnora praestabilis]|nr:MAG: DNA-directed RNA polymerase [Pycnora praestabilis]